MFKRLAVILPLLLIVNLVSCANTPPLNMPSERLSNVSPQEGIVIGSIQIKTKEYKGRKLFKYNFKGKACDVMIFKNDQKPEKKTDGPIKYQVSATADGNEVPFVAVLTAGKYAFRSIRINVFSDPQHGGFYAPFDVLPGQAVYIGKLEISLPDYGRYGFHVSTDVKDTQDATIQRLRREYANFDQPISKRLIINLEGKESSAPLCQCR